MQQIFRMLRLGVLKGEDGKKGGGGWRVGERREYVSSKPQPQMPTLHTVGRSPSDH